MAQTGKTKTRAGKKSGASKKPAKSRVGRGSARDTGRKNGAARTRADAAESPRRRGSLVWRITKALISLSIWGVVALTAVLAYYGWTLPDVTDIEKATLREAGFAVIDAEGGLVARTGKIHGDHVTLADLPPYLPNALIAIEDRRFRDHPGIDVVGLARAAWTNLLAGGVRQGGSTLTQQLAKNLFLSPDRTLRRKIQEVLLAFWLESNLSKDQILEIYLNRVYLGAGAYGVDAAARTFFGKPAGDVTLFQAAVLAGLPKAPSRYNPVADPEQAAERAAIVLNAMADSGMLTQAEADAAKRPTVPVVRADTRGRYGRYFADWAVGRAADIAGGANRDLIITTTLEPDLQHLAEKTIADHLPAILEAGASQTALIAMRPDGAVVAMVGGTDWQKTQFNRAVHAYRQPGSTFKFFAYLAALEAGLTPDTMIDPRAGTIGDWTPRDFSKTPDDPVTLRDGFAKSLNRVSVAVGERAGRAKIIDLAHRLGITADLSPDRSLSLGVHGVTLIELTGAYATLPNGGNAVLPYGISRIEERGGETLYVRQRQETAKVLETGVARTMHSLLASVIEYGTGRNARIGRTAGGKSGTSQDYRDGWFVGYTPDLVVGVWIGNDDGSPSKRITGGGLPARMWGAFMTAATAHLPDSPMPFPEQKLFGGFFNFGGTSSSDGGTAPEPSQRIETIQENSGRR
ncbi:transglycosylase domain-containing protein [Hwanghaeella sp.]|uniref:transglycosylase domain-containing protein n=1 Tax=Hwanghaeella sp. TaxID=2605943 RepID=UPI003CCC0D0F